MFDIAFFLRQSVRVMNVATLPRRKEFEKIVTTTALGMLIIGAIGSILAFIFSFI